MQLGCYQHLILVEPLGLVLAACRRGAVGPVLAACRASSKFDLTGGSLTKLEAPRPRPCVCEAALGPCDDELDWDLFTPVDWAPYMKVATSTKPAQSISPVAHTQSSLKHK